MPSRVELAAKILSNQEYRQLLENSGMADTTQVMQMAALLGVHAENIDIGSSDMIRSTNELIEAEIAPHIDYKIVGIQPGATDIEDKLSSLIADSITDKQGNPINKVTSFSIVSAGHIVTLSVVPPTQERDKTTLVFHDSLSDGNLDSFNRVCAKLNFTEDFKSILSTRFNIVSCAEPEQIELEGNKNSCWLRSITRALTIPETLPPNPQDIFDDKLHVEHTEILAAADSIRAIQEQGRKFVYQYFNANEEVYKQFTNRLEECGIPKESQAIFFDRANKKILFAYSKHELEAMFFQFSSYMFAERSKDFDKEQHLLEANATTFFGTFSPTQPVTKIPNQLETNFQISDTPGMLIGENQGVCIGETHDSIASKKFLIDNMETFKVKGVKTIFLEHILYDIHQKELDEYMKSPDGTPMPKGLEIYLDQMDSGHMSLFKEPKNSFLSEKYNFTAIIKAAKRAGIRVVALDTETSYFIYKPDLYQRVGSVEQRYKVMNYQAKKIIDSEKSDGKWVAFVGSGHSKTNKGVPGISEIMGVNSVIVEDKTENNVEGIKTHVEKYRGLIDPDMVITMGISNFIEDLLKDSYLLKYNNIAYMFNTLYAFCKENYSNDVPKLFTLLAEPDLINNSSIYNLKELCTTLSTINDFEKATPEFNYN